MNELKEAAKIVLGILGLAAMTLLLVALMLMGLIAAEPILTEVTR